VSTKAGQLQSRFRLQESGVRSPSSSTLRAPFTCICQAEPGALTMRVLAISKAHGPRLSHLVAILTVAVLTVGVLAIPSAVANERPGPACAIHGHLTEGDITGVPSDVIHGNIEVFTFTHPIIFTGAFNGVGIAQERAVYNLLTPDVGTVHDRIVYTGPVTCDDGRVLGVGGFEINFVAALNNVDGTFTGRFQVSAGSGGLEGLHGHGTSTGVQGTPGGNGPYIGTLRLGGDA